MISLSLSMGIGTAGGSPGPTYDYYISTTGNDSNDGTSLAQAWKSLSKVGSIALPAASSKTVVVKAGTYNTASDYVLRGDADPGGAPGAGSTLTITFEEGCTMDGTAANLVAATNGFEFAGAATWTTYVYGNGLAINNYNKTGDSPNGLGNRGTHILHAFDVVVDNSNDGVSAHQNSQMYIWRSTFRNCNKSAFAHIDSTHTRHYSCNFEGRASATLGIGALVGATVLAEFEDCTFIPAATAPTLDLNGGTLTRCQIGTLTASVTMSTSSGVTATINESYVNAYTDGQNKFTLDLCYGKFSTRVRNGGAINVQYSVLSAPATGQTAIIFSNFNPGSASKMVFNSNIVQTATAAAFMNIDATNAGYLVAASSEFFNSVLSGSAAFDADLLAADPTHVVVANNVTANALIGAANTLNPDDYGYGPGSPAIGAGVGGTNSGFAIGEVPPVGG